MADAEYKRLGCASFECTDKSKSNGLCAMHYMRLKRTGTTSALSKQCAHCGESFETQRQNAMYCSSRCKVAAWAERHAPDRAKKVKATEASALIKLLVKSIKKLAHSKRLALFAESRRKTEEASKNTQKPCLTCGGDCNYVFGAPKKYCSDDCRKQSPEYKSQRKIERKKRGKGHVQRAKKLGCAYSHFNVLKVFARDRWTCQLCGIKTPERLRGSIDPRAPELDHILALALGGGHLIENCQCSCRKCNSEKGAGSSGQMWLEGCA